MTNAAPAPKPKKPTPPAAGPAPEVPEPRTTEEAYALAVSSSNLRMHMDADRGSTADILVAAGWSQSRIGASLMRLHSQWEHCEHPVRLEKDAVQRLAQERVDKFNEKAKPDLLAAQAEADRWYLHECALVLQRLKELPATRAQLTAQIVKWKVFDAADKAPRVILWWLDQNCPACNGTKYGPSGRGTMCKPCKGSG